MQYMRNEDLTRWLDKNEKLNSDRELSIGLKIVDRYRNEGIVVKIEPSSDEQHGTIYSWQINKFNYGSDNCEHYSFECWKRELRIID